MPLQASRCHAFRPTNPTVKRHAQWGVHGTPLPQVRVPVTHRRAKEVAVTCTPFPAYKDYQGSVGWSFTELQELVDWGRKPHIAQSIMPQPNTSPAYSVNLPGVPSAGPLEAATSKATMADTLHQKVHQEGLAALQELHQEGSAALQELHQEGSAALQELHQEGSAALQELHQEGLAALQELQGTHAALLDLQAQPAANQQEREVLMKRCIEPVAEVAVQSAPVLTSLKAKAVALAGDIAKKISADSHERCCCSTTDTTTKPAPAPEFNAAAAAACVITAQVVATKPMTPPGFEVAAAARMAVPATKPTIPPGFEAAAAALMAVPATKPTIPPGFEAAAAAARMAVPATKPTIHPAFEAAAAAARMAVPATKPRIPPGFEGVAAARMAVLATNTRIPPGFEGVAAAAHGLAVQAPAPENLNLLQLLPGFEANAANKMAIDALLPIAKKISAGDWKMQQWWASRLAWEYQLGNQLDFFYGPGRRCLPLYRTIPVAGKLASPFAADSELPAFE